MSVTKFEFAGITGFVFGFEGAAEILDKGSIPSKEISIEEMMEDLPELKVARFEKEGE